MRFGKKGKFSPRFIGPFEILEQVGATAYHLALPPSMTAVHDVFHVSMIRKYVRDSSHVLKVQYELQPAKILDRKEKVLRNKAIP